LADLSASDGAGVIRVLHVDNDTSILEITKHILMAMGNFEVDCACCVNEAFKKLSAGKYDIIISDYEMQHKNGLQFLKELREKHNRIPFLFFTGKGREEVVITALNLGADGYINRHHNPKTVFGELVHTIRTIVEKAHTEEALRLSEIRYRSLVDRSFDGVMLTRPDGTILSANPQACRMLGMTEEEIKKAGREGIVVKNEKLATALKERERTGSAKAELPFTRKDGTTFIGEVSSVVFTDAEGVTKTSMIIRDVTDRKKAEDALKQTLDQLKLVIEKLSVIGSLTRHDARNKLMEMSGYAYLLKRKYGGQKDIVEGLSKIEQKIEEVERIFKFAKLYEQLGADKLTYVDVEKTVNDAVGLFSDLTIKVFNECHGLTVLADSLLRQLFYNFIDDTKKHGKKTTAIRVYCEKADSGDLRLIYEDNGVGISAENKLKLFKEGSGTGGSTGFGLFLIKKITDAYGWTIVEEGEPGKGVKFTITIPKLNKDGKESFQFIL